MRSLAHIAVVAILCGFVSEIKATACDERSFSCRSDHSCIIKSWVCDDDQDCVDGSDEEHCDPRVCDDGEFSCGDGHKCIPERWHCDGDPDCSDESDEDIVFCSNKTCPQDHFSCGTPGQCVPNSWVCDGQSDCQHGEDEGNCTVRECDVDEFMCDSKKQCVLKRWKCDGEKDCQDGSDEEGCEQLACGLHQFQCRMSKQCIPERWTCDNALDCHDGSDEVNCTRKIEVQHHCSNREFMCTTNGDCIHDSWKCDGDKDCYDGSDEHNCDGDAEPKVCAGHEFTCGSGICLPGSAVCNGKTQCQDGTDEQNCDTEPPSCDSEKKFDCGNGLCIDFEKLCDGQRDCSSTVHDSKDENYSLCNDAPNPCEENNGGCGQHCVFTGAGRHYCKCIFGYELAADDKLCKDIDECEIFGICSQICNNTKGSHKCSCLPGYDLDLHPNPNHCKLDPSIHGEPSIIFANRHDVRELKIVSGHYTLLQNNSHSAVAVVCDNEKRILYYTDVVDEKIFSHKIGDPAAPEAILSGGITTPDGLALDWIHQNLYWTDTADNIISVYSLKTKHRKTLLNQDLDEPRAIVVDPRHNQRYLYWTDWGVIPKIERSGLDGQHRHTLAANGTLLWPNGLTIDYTTNRLYWIDAKNQNIGSCLLDGRDNRLIYSITMHLDHPFAIAVFEDYIYWTDWGSESIQRADKYGRDTTPTAILHGLASPMDMHIYHKLNQPDDVNVCSDSNGGCSHLCLPSRYINQRAPRLLCACPDDTDGTDAIHWELENEVTCKQRSGHLVAPTGTKPLPIAAPSKKSHASGAITAIVVVVLLAIVVIVSVIGFLVYRAKVGKNGRSLNFDNPVYRKTTEDQFSLEKNQYQPAVRDIHPSTLEPLTAGTTYEIA